MRYRRAFGLAAALSTCALAAACGSNVVAPLTPGDAALIQQFIGLQAHADSDADATRAEEYRGIVRMLSEGARVNQVDIAIDGRPSPFSAVAAMVVLPAGDGNAGDSTYGLAAWRGTGSDTLVMMLDNGSGLLGRTIGSGTVLPRIVLPRALASRLPISPSVAGQTGGRPVHVLLTIGTSDWNSVPDSTSASLQQTGIGLKCNVIRRAKLRIVHGDPTCQRERATVSMDAWVDSTRGPDGGRHEVSLAASSLGGVRLQYTP